ncbi:MAG: DUF6044 family protein, partial [Gammaproteobacteria bacterium]
LLPLIISFKRFYIPSFEFDLDRVMLFYPIIIISVFYILFDRFPKKKFYIYLTLFLSFIINLNSNVEISQNIIYQFSKNTKPVSLINSIIVNPINKSIKNSNWPFSILSEKGLFGNDKKLNEFSEITVVRFKEFYSEESFNEIKKVIDSDYQALAIGFHPAILHYNGVNSLNTYLVHYPLTYKKNFREIIENELNKNNDAKNSFDSWGNRAYTYVNDLNSSCKNECFRSSSRKEKIKNLDLNLEKFKSMNGRYIISAVQIENNEALNLKLIKFISIDSSIYDFYIYSI